MSINRTFRTISHHLKKITVYPRRIKIRLQARFKGYSVFHNEPTPNYYQFFKKLGQGVWGSVALTTRKVEKHNSSSQTTDSEDTDKALHRFYATKTLKRKRTSKAFHHEVTMLKVFKGVDHIIQFVDENIGEKTFHITMENAGVDFTHLLKQQTNDEVYDKYQNMKRIMTSAVTGHTQEHALLDEKLAARLFHQALFGLKSMHDKGFLHHDIKPSNLFVDHTGYVSVGDLGCTEPATSGKPCRGGYRYAPPEKKAGKPHTAGGDLWMLGITMAECLIGKQQVMGKIWGLPPHIIHQNIIKASLPKDKDTLPLISQEAKDVLLKLLTVNPDERPSVEEILAMPFFDRPDNTATASA